MTWTVSHLNVRFFIGKEIEERERASPVEPWPRLCETPCRCQQISVHETALRPASVGSWTLHRAELCIPSSRSGWDAAALLRPSGCVVPALPFPPRLELDRWSLLCNTCRIQTRMHRAGDSPLLCNGGKQKSFPSLTSKGHKFPLNCLWLRAQLFPEQTCAPSGSRSTLLTGSLGRAVCPAWADVF